MSARQGTAIDQLLVERGLERNALWARRGPMVVDESLPLPTIELRSRARVTLLSPTHRGLERLWDVWDKTLQELGVEPPRPSVDRLEEPIEGQQTGNASGEQAARGEPPTIFISYATDDHSWLELLRKHLRANPRTAGFRIEVSDPSVDAGRVWSATVDDVVGRATLAVVLASPAYLASDWLRRELDELMRRSDQDELRLTWIALRASVVADTPLSNLQALAPPSRPLDALRSPQQEEMLASITDTIADAAKATPIRQDTSAAPRSTGSVDVEALARRPFRSDVSVANGSSLAFLFEAEGRAVLIGGDAHADVLERSIRRLIDERAINRLPLDAFVVPHNGSDRNLSRTLLELLACDRYLISSDGARFRHPDRATIARVITFGRSHTDAALTLVFNYRSEANAMWDDAELMRRYRYQTIYPDTAGAMLRITV